MAIATTEHYRAYTPKPFTRAERDAVMGVLRAHGLSRHSHVIGSTNTRGVVEIWRDAKLQQSLPLRDLQQAWDSVSWQIARLRDFVE